MTASSGGVHSRRCVLVVWFPLAGPLVMKDSNNNPADDMVIRTTNSTFPVSGGLMTNPSTTNGEWVVLFCWDGASDLVCDLDYASWGVNSASNPKMDKTGVAIDGPDAGAVASSFLADTPAGTQSNLGTALAKPNTFQRISTEVGETALGGNGCLGRAQPTTINWVPVAGTPNIRFHIRWSNLDEENDSPPVSGSMRSQEFGVFLPDFGDIGNFNVPPLQPNSFFDVFFDVPLSALPPQPQKITPNSQGLAASAASMRPGLPSATNAFCPPDTNWAGNVDIFWTASNQNGSVNKHYTDLRSCAGGAPSFVHFRGSNCTSPMPWSVAGLCPGFTVTLVNEDFSAAPNPLPVGWTGWIKLQVGGAVAAGTSCCPSVIFQCNGASSTVDLCTTACDCQPIKPQLSAVDWTQTGTTVRFHQHWTNPDPSGSSAPVSGTMTSQKLGVFLPDFGPIGPFNIPAIASNSFFDVFLDVPLAQLPPEPTRQGGPPPSTTSPPCFPDLWHGNVNVTWSGPGGSGQVGRHFDEVPVCPGGTPTYVFLETDCLVAAGATWSIAGLCPGFTATLVNLDNSPAPNPLPTGWVGKICVRATAATPVGTLCCFLIKFDCGGVPAVIEVCAKTCPCPRKPMLKGTDWKRNGSAVRFHMSWENPDPSGNSDPVSGTMMSQKFGAFLPDFGPIGQFDVPPIAPNSFFDVFFDVPLTQLPPEPAQELPGGGPAPGTQPCPPDTSWSGNVDIQWSGLGGVGQVNRHFTSLLVRPGSGSSHVHTLIFCTSSAGSPWTITGLCPGWNATLLNENFTPAPNPVPANWTGWISVSANAGVLPGASCCFTVTFTCDGVPGVIDVCATACYWPTSGVPENTHGVEFGIYTTTPNPSSSGMLIGYAMPKPGSARLEIYTLGGQRVRTLLDGQLEGGMGAVRWNGQDQQGRRLAPGAYFVRFLSGERVSSKRIVMIQ